MLSEKENDIIINKYYNEVLKEIGKNLSKLFNGNQDYYEMINNNIINNGKIYLKNFKYIKDIFLYYHIYISNNYGCYQLLGDFIKNIIIQCMIDCKVLSSPSLINSFLNKVKEEEI